MKSLWNDNDSKDALRHWTEPHGDAFALCLYSARLLGSDPALVLHGGGNVSVKGTVQNVLGESVESLFIKASGADMAALDATHLPAVDLTQLRRLRKVNELDDAQLANEFRRALFDSSAPTPSIESLVHAFIPYRFVDHSHADSLLVLTHQPDGEAVVRSALDDRVAVLPYIEPGFRLAKQVAKLFDAPPRFDAIALLRHGLITFADDARVCYERHIAIVNACENYIAQHRRPSLKVSVAPLSDAETAAAMIAPVLRGKLAVPTGDPDHPYQRSILEWRANQPIIDFLAKNQAESLLAAGPLTGDHVIRTKPWPLFVESFDRIRPEQIAAQLGVQIDGFRKRYTNYVQRHGGSADAVDSAPNVVFIRGVGLFSSGATSRDARIAADIAEHTLLAKSSAQAIGEFKGLPEADCFQMEFRALQQAKVRRSTANPHPLAGQVVAISGGAGAIGAAVADVCIEAGAHVAIADFRKDAVDRVLADIAARHGSDRVFGVVMDVCNESSVAAGFDQIVRQFGGIDLAVPNAGIAHVAAIDELTPADFRHVMEVNTVGYLLFMQAAVRVMKAQGLGGSIVVNASKNVFAPGKDFAAYSTSKAAGHQLGKVAALDLARYGIRVNMVNADAIFGDTTNPSQLWSKVGPGRAKSRGMTEQELPEYYRQRNLLQCRVTGRHVGNAVVFFASNATPTTGATLPVDGGLPEAFPR